MIRPKVLIVEDTELNRDLLTQLLEDDYFVVTAVDGADGIEAARRERPDIVLMDLSLPVMNGWEATQAIRADPELRDTIVIAVTAHAMREERERARTAGVDDYLTKPIDEDLLFAMLRSHLGERR